MELLIPLLLLLLAAPLVVALLRANELFVLRLRNGQLRVVRGRIPGQLLDDIRDVLRQSELSDVELKGVVEDGRAKLYAHGERFPRHLRQRLRNTISLWPVPKIRNAPKRRR